MSKHYRSRNWAIEKHGENWPLRVWQKLYKELKWKNDSILFKCGKVIIKKRKNK